MLRAATRSYPRTLLAGPALALAGLVALGCAESTVVEAPLTLRLADATSCRPLGIVARVRVRALGDGPPSEAAVIELAPSAAPRAIPELPFDVLAVHVAAESGAWRGLGYRSLLDRGSDVLLLPPGRPCALADPEARAPIGAAIAVIAGGVLVIAGGLDDEGVAIGRIASLAPSAQLVEIAELELASPSAFASATPLSGGRLLVAGGAIAENAPAYRTFEQIDPLTPAGSGRVVGTLVERRRDHAAIALRDGRVMLVGGREGGEGEALASIELVDPDAMTSATARASLVYARIAPVLALAEDGRVWIAGGESEGDRSIERFDPVAQTIEAFAVELPAPDAIAPYGGDRLAWISGDRAFVVLLRDEGPIVVAPAAGVRFAGVEAPSAVSTASGRVWIGGRASAVLWDAGRGTFTPRSSSRAPSKIARLGDGSLIELSSRGADVRREDEPTSFDDPPATILFASDDAWLVLDPTGRVGEPAPRWMSPRFEQEGTELVARAAGARADVRALRASRMDVTLRVSGAVELLVVRDDAPPIVVAIDDDSLTLGGCSAARTASTVVQIEPGVVRLGDVACAAPIEGRVGIAVRAREVGARLTNITVARR